MTSLRANADDPPTADQSLQILLLELDLELAQLNLSELETGVDAALTAAVAQNQLAVDELNSQIEASKIVAPAGGTILRALARPEQLISPTDNAFIMADINNLELRALADEEDLALMLEGMTGISQRAGRPGPEVEAELTTLPAEFGGDGTEENIVRFTLDNQGTDYDVNDRATVVLLIGEVNDVVWLPPQAIREFRGRKFVVVEDGEGQRRIDIETGLESNDRVEIIPVWKPGRSWLANNG